MKIVALYSIKGGVGNSNNHHFSIDQNVQASK